MPLLSSMDVDPIEASPDVDGTVILMDELHSGLPPCGGTPPAEVPIRIDSGCVVAWSHGIFLCDDIDEAVEHCA